MTVIVLGLAILTGIVLATVLKQRRVYPPVCQFCHKGMTRSGWYEDWSCQNRCIWKEYQKRQEKRKA